MNTNCTFFQVGRIKIIVISFFFVLSFSFPCFSQRPANYNLTPDQLTTISIIGNYCNFIINQADVSFDYKTVVNGGVSNRIG